MPPAPFSLSSDCRHGAHTRGPAQPRSTGAAPGRAREPRHGLGGGTTAGEGSPERVPAPGPARRPTSPGCPGCPGCPRSPHPPSSAGCRCWSPAMWTWRPRSAAGRRQPEVTPLPARQRRAERAGSGAVTSPRRGRRGALRARLKGRDHGQWRGGSTGRDHRDTTGELRLLFCLNNDWFRIRASAKDPRATGVLLKVTTRRQAQGRRRLSGSGDRGGDTPIPFLWPTAPTGRGEQLAGLSAALGTPQPHAPFVLGDKGAGHAARSKRQARLKARLRGALSVLAWQVQQLFWLLKRRSRGQR